MEAGLSSPGMAAILAARDPYERDLLTAAVARSTQSTTVSLVFLTLLPATSLRLPVNVP
jgi:hypothetical protein